MRQPLALACSVVLLVLAGCASPQRPALSPACTGGPGPVRQALRAAPGAVRLPDGSRLSDCLTNADSEGELQDAGVLLTRVADDLAADGDALALGYLIGAARRGGARTNGIASEMAHRMEASARRMPSGSATELQRGLAAGERSG